MVYNSRIIRNPSLDQFLNMISLQFVQFSVKWKFPFDEYLKLRLYVYHIIISNMCIYVYIYTHVVIHIVYNTYIHYGNIDVYRDTRIAIHMVY